jgi:hypothetical protein
MGSVGVNPLSNRIISVDSVLRRLESRGPRLDSQLSDIGLIADWAAIGGRLFESYQLSEGRATDKLVAPKALLEAAGWLIIGVRDLLGDGHRLTKLKWINTAHKILDSVERAGGSVAEPRRHLEALLASAEGEPLENFTVGPGLIIPASPRNSLSRVGEFTMLFWEGPVARAYLAVLREAGVKPRRLINLISSRDLATGARYLPWLGGAPRAFMCESLQRSRAHHWASQIRRVYGDLVDSMTHTISECFGIDPLVFQEAQTMIPLSAYCDDVRDVLVDDLADPVLLSVLMKERGPVLYTGGGIVPVSITGLENIELLHVHPGILPGLRGSDCALWSLVGAGYPTATLFRLRKGIDTGPIVAAAVLPSIKFKVERLPTDLKTIYRAIFAFYDPWVRAVMLRRAIGATNCFSHIEARPQSEVGASLFRFMHPELYPFAFRALFSSHTSQPAH